MDDSQSERVPPEQNAHEDRAAEDRTEAMSVGAESTGSRKEETDRVAATGGLKRWLRAIGPGLVTACGPAAS